MTEAAERVNGSEDPVADIVKEVIALMRGREDVTLEECILLFGKQSIVIALLLLSLLSSLPLTSIPGFSTITGIPIILLGLQLLFAKKTLWLPGKLRNYRMSSARFVPRLEKLEKRLRAWERYVHPRIAHLSAPPIRNLTGLLFIFLATLLALPIPGLNYPTGITMSILAIGLIERDGYIIGTGIAFVGMIIAAVIYFSYMAS